MWEGIRGAVLFRGWGERSAVGAHGRSVALGARLATELFDPARGLVVPVTLEGVEHARLCGGGDLKQLEAGPRVAAPRWGGAL